MRKSVLILLALALVLAACGGGKSDSDGSSSGGSTSGQSEGQSEAQEISGEITVFGWGGGEELQSRKDATEVFRKLYPKVKVNEIWLPADEVDIKLDAALAAGNAGDVIMLSPDWRGLRSKWFEDLTPYVERDNLDLESLFTPGVDDGYVLPDGKRDGMPTTASDFMIAYNKKIFDEAGVPYPTEDWTWDDFCDIGLVGGEAQPVVPVVDVLVGAGPIVNFLIRSIQDGAVGRIFPEVVLHPEHGGRFGEYQQPAIMPVGDIEDKTVRMCCIAFDIENFRHGFNLADANIGICNDQYPKDVNIVNIINVGIKETTFVLFISIL